MYKTEVVEANTNNLVTKSNLLIEANYKLGVTEQKIILCIASKIQPDDSDFKTYTLPIKEFNKLLGLKGTPKYTELRKITKDLMQKVFEIRIENKVIQVAWLSYVAYNVTEGTIDIRFDPFLRPYLLQLKKEFTSYKLDNVVKLKSSYAIRIYELLKQYERVQERTFSLEHLRRLLGAEDLYPAYGNFKQRVLIPAQKELEKKTDITFELEEMKSGRRVDKVKFVIRSKRKAAKQLNLFDDTFEAPQAPAPSSSYEKLRGMALSLGVNLSMETYQKWVETYGEVRVVQVIEETINKPNVKNPIGYITFMLRESTDGSLQAAAGDEEQKEQDLLLYLVSRYRNSKEKLPYWLIEEKAVQDIEHKLSVPSDDALYIFTKVKQKFFEALGFNAEDRPSPMQEEEFLKMRDELSQQLKQYKNEL
ncbi:replication initiation protein [Priestia abyssalis]|uniref:replication initiation protein n=1 Tax=Priestia abyssalis TaxID=1221450 RepID=UPI0011176759|nr:replication initiation protein [Priestia abyssalis]